MSSSDPSTVARPSNKLLQVFISSRMVELRDTRQVLADRLRDRGISAWVFENDAGAQPESVVDTSLQKVDEADVYVGLFWKDFGPVTIDEFRRARDGRKPCFVYLRDRNFLRDPRLEEFLQKEIYSPSSGVTYSFFDSITGIGDAVADDILAWLVRRYRQLSVEVQTAASSDDKLIALRREVSRLRTLTESPLPEPTPLDFLAQNLRSWFKTLGYSLERTLAENEKQFDWILNVPARRRYDRILVRGVEGTVGVFHVTELRATVEESRANEGWLITARRIAPAAHAELEKPEYRHLSCYTFDDLLDQDADFSGYLEWLESEVKRRNIDKYYVPLACVREEVDPVTRAKIGESRFDESNGWIDSYINQWLDDPSKEHISVLGEFGTGKTWFTLHYAWILMHRYQQAKSRGIERPRLPLVIPLRDYAKAVSVESLFSEFFFRKHEINLPGYSVFQHLNGLGRFVLLFDGFDEMAAKVDHQSMVNNFWELARVVVPRSKVILTCRTEHFPTATQGRALLNAELWSSTANLTGEPPQFEVLQIEKLNDAQIRQILTARSRGGSVNQILSHPRLLDLARRPVMIEFILDALPEVEAGKPVDLSRIYLYSTRRKMETAIKEERTFTSLADKLYFLCEVSWEMLSTDRMSINYRLIPDRVRALFSHAVQEQKDLDHWHYDMLGQTMLIRNAEGDYSPAHRSLLEFFVAYKFSAELGVLTDDFIEPAKSQSAIDSARPPTHYTWTEYFRRQRVADGRVTSISPLAGFSPLGAAELRDTVGRMPFTRAILDLMENMIDRTTAFDPERGLKAVINTTREAKGGCGFTAGNILSVLIRLDRAALAGADISHLDLRSADLSSADLSDCNLSGSNLSGVQFRGVTLTRANLENADLTDAVFAETGAVNAVSLSADCGVIASGGEDGRIFLWDCGSGRPTGILQGHRGTVQSLSWHKGGRYLVSGGEDAKVRIWDVETGDCVEDLSKHSASVVSVSFSPSGDFIATGSKDGSVLLLRFPGSTVVHDKKFSGHAYAVRFSHDEKLVANRSRRGTVVLWDLHTGQEVYRLEGARYGDAVTHISFHPRGDIVAVTVGNRFFRTWSIASSEVVADIGNHEARVNDMCFSPDGSYIASCDSAGSLHLYDAANGSTVAQIAAHNGPANCVRFSSDGAILVTGGADAAVRIWSVCALVACAYSQTECAKQPASTVGPLYTLQQKIDCKGLRIEGAKGLDAEGYTTSLSWGYTYTSSLSGTLAEWLIARGAVRPSFRPTDPIRVHSRDPDSKPSPASWGE